MNKGYSVIIFIILLCSPVLAHDSQPAYLEIIEDSENVYKILWRVPKTSGQSLGAKIIYPNTVSNITNLKRVELSDSTTESFLVLTNNTGFIDQQIIFSGLEKTSVLIRMEFNDGTSSTSLIDPDKPWIIIEGPRSSMKIAYDYIKLGGKHILSGWDHLLFVLALLLIVAGWRKLFLTITAFTVAHSITLAASTLGILWIPTPPTEAVIALSIVFLSSELIKVNKGKTSLTANWPWAVAFVFGLLHGLGFAGALTEIGLPASDIPLALLSFNIGVELGQISFVLLILLGIFFLKKLNINWPKWTKHIPAYGIGALATFWFIERVIGFW